MNKLTANEINEIQHITARALDLAKEHGLAVDKTTVYFAVSAVHQIQPLKLRELRFADDGNFGHDVFGIIQNFNPQANGFAGGLENCFSPRYSA
jgi:hypothetical protein